MILKDLRALRNFCTLSLLLLGVVSCEDDVTTLGSDFINNTLETTAIASEVGFSNEDISFIETISSGKFLLGVYNDSNFGTLSASFVSQLVLPSDTRYYLGSSAEGTEVTPFLDDVVLFIPYESTYVEFNSDKKYVYNLNLIYGNYLTRYKDYNGFDIEVSELDTFLSDVNPTSPTESIKLYSNKTYATKKLLAKKTIQNISLLDSVIEISRKSSTTTEKIRLTNNAPFLSVRLDKDYFKDKFLAKMNFYGEARKTGFTTQKDFIRYFKGLLVNVTSTDAASIATLDLSKAYVNLYYTNVIKNTATGKNTDSIAATKTFTLGGVKANVLKHNHTRTSVAEKMYVQGANGSLSNIHLFGYNPAQPNVVSEELKLLRAESNTAEGLPKWLINKASLKVYVDESFAEKNKDTITRLFLYKKTPTYNSQLLDYIPSTTRSVSGSLGLLKEDTSENGGYYYEFIITNYISNLLKGTNTSNVDNLALKVYNEGDFPQSPTDTIVSSASWDPRGVVLHGGKKEITDPKRILLTINYSKRK